MTSFLSKTRQKIIFEIKSIFLFHFKISRRFFPNSIQSYLKQKMVCHYAKVLLGCEPSFLVTIFLLIGMPFIYIHEYLILLQPPCMIPVLILFVLLLLMTIWSLLATAFSDPGYVPSSCNITSESREASQLKHCTKCHIIKPERCHHCSICKKCILNMDHHCSWVNNCIGFLNRKFFILFLFYLKLTIIIVTVSSVLMIIPNFAMVIENNQADIHFILRLLCLVLSLPLSFGIGIFFAYHFNMVLENTTSIETMIRKKNHTEYQEDNYDLGNNENFMQVFGQNRCYWLIPIHGDGPKGNGILWPRQYYPQYFITENY